MWSTQTVESNVYFKYYKLSNVIFILRYSENILVKSVLIYL